MRTTPLLGGRAWFGPKRLGWGWSPVSAAGWIVTVVWTAGFVPLTARYGAVGAIPMLVGFVAVVVLKGTSPGGAEQYAQVQKGGRHRSRPVDDEPQLEDITPRLEHRHDSEPVTRMRRLLRSALVGAGAVVPTVLGVRWWSRLPDPVAVHWGISGAADGSGPRWLLVAVGPSLAAIGLLARAATSRRPADARGFEIGAAVGTIALGVGVLSLQANLDRPTWQAAGDLPIPLVLGFIGLGLGLGWLLGRPIGKGL